MFTKKHEITTAEVKKLHLDVYRRYRSGRIDKERAKQEGELLLGLLRAVSEAEQSERLEEIKIALRG